MKGASVFLASLGIVTVGVLGTVYITHDKEDKSSAGNPAQASSTAADTAPGKEDRLLEQQKAANEQLRRQTQTLGKGQAPSSDGLVIPDSAPAPGAASSQDEVARIKAENERLKNSLRMAQEEASIITDQQLQIQKSVEKRQNAIAQAILVGKTKGHQKSWNIVEIQAIGQPGLEKGAKLGIRRNKGILCQLVVTETEGDTILANAVLNKFSGEIQPGDEVVIYPEIEGAPIEIDAAPQPAAAPDKTPALPGAPAGGKAPKDIPVGPKPKLPDWPKD